MNRPDNPGDPRPADRREEVRELLQDLRSDVRKTSAGGPPPGEKSRSKVLYAGLAILILANAYIWIAQPESIVGERSGITTVEEAEGLLRFRMFVQAQRLHFFQRQHGDLPETLDQTGEPFEGIRYVRTGPDSWELVGEFRGARLTLPSTMTMEEFLQSGEPQALPLTPPPGSF